MTICFWHNVVYVVVKVNGRRRRAADDCASGQILSYLVGGGALTATAEFIIVVLPTHHWKRPRALSLLTYPVIEVVFVPPRFCQARQGPTAAPQLPVDAALQGTATTVILETLHNQGINGCIGIDIQSIDRG